MEPLYEKLRIVFCGCALLNNRKTLETKLERKIIKLKRSNVPGDINFTTIDAIILKFPQFREGFKEIEDIFQQYDEDSNGSIHIEGIKKCLRALELKMKNDEIDDLFHYCDMDENKEIKFNEFIVLLCLAYLLVDSSASSPIAFNIKWPKIKSTFDAIVRVFLFFDKSGNGKLKRDDVVRALNEATPKEKSPSHITQTRFEEMDWDKNGKVSFKEFVYAFINWVGDEEETPE